MKLAIAKLGCLFLAYKYLYFSKVGYNFRDKLIMVIVKFCIVYI